MTYYSHSNVIEAVASNCSTFSYPTTVELPRVSLRFFEGDQLWAT